MSKIRNTLVLLLSLLVVSSILSPSYADSNRTYPSKIDGYALIDPATLAVRFHVYNNGTRSISPSCSITAQDDSGAYHGFNVFSLRLLAAGATANGTGDIVITGQGANFVTQVKINCTAQTSDTGTISGSVAVIKVDPPTTDGYAGHDSSGWFWGGIPIVSAVPDNTQVKCTVRALDAKGHVLTTYTFNGQVNQGGVSGPGVQNTSSDIGSKIKSASASCQLGSGDTAVQVPPVSSQASGTPSTSTSQSWYPSGYEEDSTGFAWKWGDNPVDCFSGKTNECWNGTLIVKQGCSHGVQLTLGLYSANGKKEVAKFTQKYFADFLPMTGVVLAINNTANPNGFNAQIDSEACLSAKEGGTNPVPLKNVPINTLYNDVMQPTGDVQVGSDFYVGSKIIKCSSSGNAMCISIDILNTAYCSKGYTFSGYLSQPGVKQGWFPLSGSVGNSGASSGVTGGTDITNEIDFTIADLVKNSGLSEAAVRDQLKLKNIAVINKTSCLN